MWPGKCIYSSKTEVVEEMRQVRVSTLCLVIVYDTHRPLKKTVKESKIKMYQLFWHFHTWRLLETNSSRNTSDLKAAGQLDLPPETQRLHMKSRIIICQIITNSWQGHCTVDGEKKKKSTKGERRSNKLFKYSQDETHKLSTLIETSSEEDWVIVQLKQQTDKVGN